MNKDIKILLSRFRESGTNKSNNYLINFLENWKTQIKILFILLLLKAFIYQMI